jgi:uncharacterized membrane protein YoaK (UPF0700 family)
MTSVSPPPTPLSKKAKALVAVGLSWGAGLTDVVGYLTLHRAFTAHMTGNTVSTVMHAAEGSWREVLHRGAPIPAFFLGLLAGEIVLERAKRRRRRHVAARALGLEAICLGLFLALGLGWFGADRAPNPSPPLFLLLVLLVAAAMGIQSASLRKVGALTIFTTFITGTLTKLADDVAKYLFWLRDRTRGRTRRRLGKALRLSVRQEPFQSTVLLAALYLSYAVGALAGVEGFQRWGVAVAAAPLLLVLSAVAIDLLRPIAPVP